MKLLSILCGASGSQKSKMAAHKDEALISQLVYNIAAQFQRRQSETPMFLRFKNSMKLFPILFDASGNLKNPRWRLTNRKYLYLSLNAT